MTAATPTSMSAPILSVRGLTIGTATRPIVRHLTFSIDAGQTLGIVGESGSGKTMTAYAIANLLPPDLRVHGGDIDLQQQSLLHRSDADRRALAGGDIGMVLQERLSAFNPVRRIGSLLIESAIRHRAVSAAHARAIAIEALRRVRLPEPEQLIDAYPHQMSGGQLQRAMIALAELNDPILLIADEPTTALDPTVQLQVLALLQARMADRAMLLITHDLAIAAAMCDRLLVMHRGECVEQGTTREIMERPQHPYTQQLLEASGILACADLPPLRSVSNQ
jgi:ABC-type glutathione transport system ATPase component